MAAVYDFTLDAGADTTITFVYKDSTGAAINLTGYSAKMELRSAPGGTLGLQLSTVNGKIVLGGAAGTVACTFSDVDSSSLTLPEYSYDVELTDGSTLITRLVQGTITVSPETTQ